MKRLFAPNRALGSGFFVWRQLAAIAFAFFALASCSPDSPRAGRLPDVLLITVDTLRPDHLGIYGYSRPTSPHLDRWFSEGAVFTPAYATESFTAPSVVSILSGQYPQAHRVRAFFQLLPRGTRLLTDFLPDSYQTAAFVSNCALTEEAMGMADRFDYYNDFVDEKEPYRLVYERNARRTTDTVLSWLKEGRDKSRPLFLWVHYIDPHGPYHSPADWQPTFTHQEHAPVNLERIPKWVREPSITDALDYVDRYDEEIAFLDVHVGRLLESFAEDFHQNRSYVVFTADHGETMMEHEMWFSHGYHVYEELIRVPLMIRGPGIEPGVRSGPASGIDIVPTILGLAGVRAPATARGVDLRKSGSIEPDRIVFAEASFSGRHWQAAVGRDGKWLAKLNSGSRTILETHWYDLTDDPGERRPVEEQQEDDALLELLRRIQDDPDPGGDPLGPINGIQLKGPKIAPRADAEALEKLRALGYVE